MLWMHCLITLLTKMSKVLRQKVASFLVPNIVSKFKFDNTHERNKNCCDET